MKRLIYCVITASIALGLGCAGTPEDNKVPFFKDTSLITGSYSNPTFTFTLPTDVTITTIVLGVFFGDPVRDQNNVLNISLLLAGNRTGLTGFTFGGNTVTLPKANVYTYTAGDFNPSSPISTAANRWVVWGSDSGGNIVASSPINTCSLP
jgi:hypothetical protein